MEEREEKHLWKVEYKKTGDFMDMGLRCTHFATTTSNMEKALQAFDQSYKTIYVFSYVGLVEMADV